MLNCLFSCPNCTKCLFIDINTTQYKDYNSGFIVMIYQHEKLKGSVIPLLYQDDTKMNRIIENILFI